MANQEIRIEEIDYKDFSVGGKEKWVRLLKFYFLHFSLSFSTPYFLDWGRN